MSQTNVALQTPLGPYAQPSAGQLAITEQAADASNGNKFTLSGHEVLVMHNTDTVAQTVTISSVADNEGRTGDITTYSIAAGAIAVYSFRGGVGGWQQSDGSVHMLASAATIKFAVLTFPN
jgi:hypothetical protein